MAGSNKTILAVCTLTILSYCAAAQDHATRMRKLDSVANITVTPDSDIAFDALEYNVGEISEDDSTLCHNFEFTNNSKSPIVIVRVSSSCGCVVADFSKKPVAAGARGTVSVVFKPKGHPGVLNRHIFVYTDTSTTPSAKLTLRGYVKPSADKWSGFGVVMGPTLRARGDKMIFSDMASGQIRTERIECVNTGQVDLQLKAMTELMPAYITFNTEPATIAAGSTGDLVVTIDATKALATGRRSEKWVIFFSNSAAKSQRYQLKIESEFK